MKNNISFLILAAGLSERMKTFKPLLLYKDKTFLENIIDKALIISGQIIIVTGKRHSNIEALVAEKYPNEKKIKIVYNSEFTDSMFISLLKGVKEVEKGNWVLYHFIDQPTIPEQFYSDFVKQIDDTSEFIQPKYKNKKGHPLLFDFNFIKHLLNSDIGSNLRDEIWKTNITKKYWECDYPEILKDYDTPEDYQNMEEH